MNTWQKHFDKNFNPISKEAKEFVEKQNKEKNNEKSK